MSGELSTESSCNSAATTTVRQISFIYKIYMASDANHECPFALALTVGNQCDTAYLAAMVEETSPTPEVVSGQWI